MFKKILLTIYYLPASFLVILIALNITLVSEKRGLTKTLLKRRKFALILMLHFNKYNLLPLLHFVSISTYLAFAYDLLKHFINA